MNYRAIIHLQHDTIVNMNDAITDNMKWLLDTIEDIGKQRPLNRSQLIAAVCDFSVSTSNKLTDIFNKHNKLLEMIQQPEQSFFDKLADEIVEMLNRNQGR